MTSPIDTNTSGDTEFSFTAGALLRRHIRHQLKRAEMYGAEWFETKGFLESSFTVRAPKSIANSIHQWLTDLAKETA